jgi:hypothetical protein
VLLLLLLLLLLRAARWSDLRTLNCYLKRNLNKTVICM